jgi:hypothetical protein
MVQSALLPLSKTLSDFKDFFRSLGEQLFVVKLRRSPQEPIPGRFCIDM